MKRLVAYSLFLLVLSSAYAQEDDAALWTGVKISQELNKKLALGYTQGFRFDNNLGNVANIFSQFKVNYKISKSFKFAVAYRYARKENWTDRLNLEHRYQIDLRYRKKFNDFAIKNRLRYQSKYRNFNTSELGRLPINYTRNETIIEYSINKKIKPYASFELFYPLNNELGLINKLRYQVGGNFKLNKMIELEVFYLIQNEFNRTNPVNSYITGVNVSVDLPSMKKKKKKKDKGDKEENAETGGE